MNDHDKYVYYGGPKDELVRDLKTDGDEMALELEMWTGGEWVNYYGPVSDLVAIDEKEAIEALRKATTTEAADSDGGYGKAPKMIDRDEVWVH